MKSLGWLLSLLMLVAVVGCAEQGAPEGGEGGGSVEVEQGESMEPGEATGEGEEGGEAATDEGAGEEGTEAGE